MKFADWVKARRLSYFAGNTRLSMAGFAVVLVLSQPGLVLGQWLPNGAASADPINRSGNVGIGTASPLARLHADVGAGGTAAIGSLIYGSTLGGTFTDPAFNTEATATLVVGSNWATNCLDCGILNLYSAVGSVLWVGTNGRVGIGTTNPPYPYKLAVEGSIGAREVVVTITSWSDYVFQPGYRLQPLSEVNEYIQANHHLPDIPSEAEVKQKGLGLGQMQAKLLAKIEELTLHVIRQERESKEIQKENLQQRERISQLESRAAGR
jgi:hypothetical protein